MVVFIVTFLCFSFSDCTFDQRHLFLENRCTSLVKIKSHCQMIHLTEGVKNSFAQLHQELCMSECSFPPVPFSIKELKHVSHLRLTRFLTTVFFLLFFWNIYILLLYFEIQFMVIKPLFAALHKHNRNATMTTYTIEWYTTQVLTKKIYLHFSMLSQCVKIHVHIRKSFRYDAVKTTRRFH